MFDEGKRNSPVEMAVVQHIEADEFGIYDGRNLARALVAYAFGLIVPYAKGCPACADQLFSAIANETIDELHNEARQEGGLLSNLFSIHAPGPKRRIAFQAHLEASNFETLRLLNRAEALYCP